MQERLERTVVVLTIALALVLLIVQAVKLYVAVVY